MPQKEYGSKTLRSLILQIIPRVSEILTVTETLKNIGFQNKLKIGNNSKIWSKKLNAYSLTRKLPTKDMALGNS